MFLACFLVIFHQRTIFAIVLKEEEPRHIVAIVMIIYVYVAKTPIAEQKVGSLMWYPYSSSRMGWPIRWRKSFLGWRQTISINFNFAAALS